MTGGQEAAARVRAWLGGRHPTVAMVLGSGLGALTEDLRDADVLSFAASGLPQVTVEGHPGAYACGLLGGRQVICQSGRIHAYEGHPADQVVLPVRLMLAAGVQTLIVTNAAGGISPGARPGCLVLIGDQLNASGQNPLFGAARGGLTDLSDAFDPGLRTLAREVARREGIGLGEGVYAGVLGPSYETPAEIRMLRGMGADMVGMSTVGEVLVARAAGARCLGISVITNRAAGLSPRRLSHTEVMEAGRGAATELRRLVRGVVAALPA